MESFAESISPDHKLVREQFGQAVGRIASGVHVVTVGQGTERDGMLATWIGQVAFEPLILSIAIKEGRPLLQYIKPDSLLVVNILAKTNMEIFKNFARPNLSAQERFEGLTGIKDSAHGPIFTTGVAYLGCQVQNIMPTGDHQLVLAEVTIGSLLQTELEPMVHFRKSGFQY